VVVAPLGLLPVIAARAIFASVTSALLAWAITRDGWGKLLVFLSVSFFVTIELGQWSAFYAAAFYLPGLGFAAIAKPNFGLALAAASSRKQSLSWLVAGTLALLGISQFLQPGWHESWLANLRTADHFKPPVLRPFGFLLLLALLKWRRPEARWLVALSVIPQAPSFYDQVLFFYVGFNTPQPDYASWGRLVGNGTLWICYFPTLIMVLRRPNAGVAPMWMERLHQRRSMVAGTGQSP
jgi:hypothetical protein